MGGGGSIFIENPREGVSRRGGAEGAGRVSAANWGFGGGGGCTKHSSLVRPVAQPLTIAFGGSTC